MPKKIKKTKCRGSVLSIIVQPDQIILFDNAYNIYLMEKESLTFTKVLTAVKDRSPWHKYAKPMDASNTGFFALSINKTNKTLIAKLDKDQKLKKRAVLEWHKSESGVVKFSPNSLFLGVGGEDGRCLFFDGTTFNLVTSALPKPDYISNIVFSDDSKLVAITSFDKRCEIFNIERNISVADFEASDVIEESFFSDDNAFVFYVCKNGYCGRYDIKESKRYEREVANEWFTRTVKLNAGKYALLCGKAQRILVLNTASLTQLFTFPLDETGVSSISIDDEKVYIGYVDGIFEVYRFDEDIEQLKEKLNQDDIAEAYKITQGNLFLKLDEQYIEAKNRLWEKYKKEAIDMIAKQQADKALALIMPFLEDGEKKEEFDYYLQQIDDMAKFIEAVEKKEYAKALALADSNTQIKNLSIYDKLEAYWQKIFDTAKKLMSKNPHINQVKARELLEPYTAVKSKKDLILTLLNNAEKYIQSEEKLKERDFAGFFRMCERFPFLKESAAYKKAMMIGEQIIDKSFEADRAKDYDKALNYLGILIDFTPFKAGAVERKRYIETKLAFLGAIRDKDIRQAYELVEKEPDLATLDEFTELKKEFAKISKVAYEKAFGGFSEQVIEILEDYLDIRYWQDKIGAIMKISYLHEIKYGADKFSPRQVDWRRSFEDYIARFGKDEELLQVAKNAKLEEFLRPIDSKGDGEGFKKLEFLTSIIAKNSEG